MCYAKCNLIIEGQYPTMLTGIGQYFNMWYFLLMRIIYVWVKVCDNVTECNKYHNSPNYVCLNCICFHSLQTEFREHFRNISRIMDCVGCDKCKLWGKLQVRNLSNSLSHNKQKNKMFFSTGKYTNHTFYLNFLFLRETCMGKNSKLYNMNDIEKQ